MKRTAVLLLLLGIALTAALIARAGAATVLDALRTAGWGLLWLVPLHALPVGLDSLGWHALLGRHGRRAGRGYVAWAAAVRDAVAADIPLSGAAAPVLGVRLLSLRGVPALDAAASVIVEGTLTLGAQLLFVALGVGLYFATAGDGRILLAAVPPLAVATALVALILALQLHGGVFGPLNRLADRIARNPRFAALAGGPRRLHAVLVDLYARRSALLRCLLWQLAGLLAGTVEIWVALHLLGEPRTWVFALLLQSVGRAARSLAFVIPAGLGIQEAVYTLIGQATGLPAPAALALSLATRFRDLVFGLPVLAGWQWQEGRRWLDMGRIRGKEATETEH